MINSENSGEKNPKKCQLDGCKIKLKLKEDEEKQDELEEKEQQAKDGGERAKENDGSDKTKRKQ